MTLDIPSSKRARLRKDYVPPCVEEMQQWVWPWRAGRRRWRGSPCAGSVGDAQPNVLLPEQDADICAWRDELVNIHHAPSHGVQWSPAV